MIGTKDPHYDENILSRLVKEVDGMMVVIEGANHGLEVSTDPEELLQVIEQVLRGLEQYFGA